jgi:hypothetical protein
MKVGDLVIFRSDTVPGLIVSERRDNPDYRNHRIGVLWMDCKEVTWEPVEYMRVISEREEGEDK